MNKRRYITAAIGAACLATVAVAMWSAPPAADPLMSSEPPRASNWLGNSPYGHDMLELLVYAAARAATDALWATLFTLAFAMPIGLVSARYPEGWFDRGQAFFAMILDSLGTVLIGICIIAVMPRINQWALGLVLAAIAWPAVSTVMRTQTIQTAGKPYVEGARAIGVSSLALFVRYIFPEIWGRIQPMCIGLWASFIALFGALSFLGAGTSTELTLGALLYDSLAYLHSSPFYFAEVAVVFMLLLAAAPIVSRHVYTPPDRDRPASGRGR